MCDCACRRTAVLSALLYCTTVAHCFTGKNSMKRGAREGKRGETRGACSCSTDRPSCVQRTRSFRRALRALYIAERHDFVIWKNHDGEAVCTAVLGAFRSSAACPHSSSTCSHSLVHHFLQRNHIMSIAMVTTDDCDTVSLLLIVLLSHAPSASVPAAPNT